MIHFGFITILGRSHVARDSSPLTLGILMAVALLLLAFWPRRN
jgi:hypothetical protein